MGDSVDKLLAKGIKLAPFQFGTQLFPIVSHVFQVSFPRNHSTQSGYLLINTALECLYRALIRCLVAFGLQYLFDVDLADLVDSGIDDHLLVSLLLHGLIKEL